MLTIKCAACKTKIFKYEKAGKGRVLKCYKSRIHKDYTNKTLNKILCANCGNIIGFDQGNYIKMKQNKFTSSGERI